MLQLKSAKKACDQVDSRVETKNVFEKHFGKKISFLHFDFRKKLNLVFSSFSYSKMFANVKSNANVIFDS